MCRGKARRNVRHSLTRSYTPKHHAEKILTTRSTRRRAGGRVGLDLAERGASQLQA
jgi:hypothetical protein